MSKSTEAATSVTNAKSATGARSETREGVTLGRVSVIPESVVSTLIGAGANVYIMANELTLSMRQKLGTSWPLVQDTLNSRYTKILAGGFVGSVGIVILWKIIRRLTRGKNQAESEEEDTNQWPSAKTYELTTVVDQQQQQAPNISEGDGADSPTTKKRKIRRSKTYAVMDSSFTATATSTYARLERLTVTAQWSLEEIERTIPQGPVPPTTTTNSLSSSSSSSSSSLSSATPTSSLLHLSAPSLQLQQ